MKTVVIKEIVYIIDKEAIIEPNDKFVVKGVPLEDDEDNYAQHGKIFTAKSVYNDSISTGCWPSDPLFNKSDCAKIIE
jgi:hypothetical protein